MILNNLHLFHPFFSARPYGLAELEGQGRSALCIPHFPIQSICLAIHYLSVGTPLTTRVVDPLSLATIADSIMVEVKDLNHYGVGLFDFCVGNIDFLARLTARSKGWRGNGFALVKPLIVKNLNIIKFRFSQQSSQNDHYVESHLLISISDFTIFIIPYLLNRKSFFIKFR